MLEVEAPCDPIHIHQLTGQMQTGAAAALHGGQVDFTQIHTPRSDEFLSKGTATFHGITALLQLIDRPFQPWLDSPPNADQEQRQPHASTTTTVEADDQRVVEEPRAASSLGSLLLQRLQQIRVDEPLHQLTFNVAR